MDALDARANRPRSRATARGAGRSGTAALSSLKASASFAAGEKALVRRIASISAAHAAQDAVVVDRGDGDEALVDRGARLGRLRRGRVPGIVARVEQRDEPARHVGRARSASTTVARP